MQTGSIMKGLSIFSACFLLCGSVKAAVPAVPGQKQRDSTLSMRRTALSIRGGDLGQLNSETLANTFSFLAGCDAVAGLLAPISSMKWFGVDIEKGSLAEYFLHRIGASAAVTAVSTFLATSGMTSTKEAIGYGFLVRLLPMTYMLLSGKHSDMGMNTQVFGVMWLVIAGTTYALFADKGKSIALAEAVSLLLAIHGAFLYAKPETFLKRATSGDSDEQLTKDMASIDGGYMMLSGIITGLLANGVDPKKVAGFGSISFVPVLVKLMDVVTVESFFGVNVEVWLMVVVTLLAAICAGTVGSLNE